MKLFFTNSDIGRLYRKHVFFNMLKIVPLLILIFICSDLRAQNKKTITGTVRDTTGVALPGVTISIENTKIGTQTDNNGKFVLDVSNGNTIRVALVGYLERKISITDNSVYNVTLKESVVVADEVVITALGQKQRSEAIVGAVTTVKPGNLKIPSSNLTNALAGKVAGIIGFQPSGQPGQDNSNFFIRGVTTFGYRQNPLILIDNVELTASDLARLQVDDIESFSVLKDASATALYGARGGNGVILVKTKEGKNGKVQINLRMESATSQSAKTLEFADPITYMRLFNEATVTRDPLAKRPFTENQILNTQATLNNATGSNKFVYPAVDWLDMLFKKNTNTKRANLNISGGGGVARYFIAGSFADDNGLLRTDIRNNNDNNVSFKNYQLRSNINIDLTKTTELVVRLSGTFNDYTGPLVPSTNNGSYQIDLYNMATHTSPVLFPAYYEPDRANANITHILFGNTTVDGQDPNSPTQINPYAELLRGHRNYSESRMLAQLEINQNLEMVTKGLNVHGIFSTNRYAIFQSNLSYDPYYYNVKSYDKQSNTYNLNWINSLQNQAREYLSYSPGTRDQNTFMYLQGSVDYNRDFGNHNISGVVIGTMQQTLSGNATNLETSLPYRNMTIAGRATYSYMRKYFLEANFGYNGSERFSENHRFGFFPTVGASWIVSSEKFFNGLTNVINRLKVRASYGLVGNDAISDRRFFYLSDVNLNGGNSATFGSLNGRTLNGVRINNYENNDITWEVSRQLNLGMELTFLKDFKIIAEVYKNDKSDILQSRPDIPSSMGLEAAISSNIGKVTSRGFEVSLDGRKDLGKSLWVSALANFTFSENKYTQYEELNYPEAYRSFLGQPINRARGFIAERLFVDDEEVKNSPKQVFSNNGVLPKGGDIKYRDLNNDGIIDGADQAFIGNPTVPQIVYGFGFSSGYKNFDISAFFQGQAKVSFFLDQNRTSPFIKSIDSYYTGNTQLIKQYAENYWSEDNQNLYALYPRLGPNGNVIENNRQNSTWWMRDGSFMRLKSLEVGYTLPSKLANRLKIRSLRIYFNGLNLFTWAPFKMWDPELGGNGFAYPIQKVYNIGLNVNL